VKMESIPITQSSKKLEKKEMRTCFPGKSPPIGESDRSRVGPEIHEGTDYREISKDGIGFSRISRRKTKNIKNNKVREKG